MTDLSVTFLVTWAIGFLQPSGLRSLPVCLWKVGVLHDSFAHGPEVLAAVAEPDASHSRKAAAAAERHDLTLMQRIALHLAGLDGTDTLLDSAKQLKKFVQCC